MKQQILWVVEVREGGGKWNLWWISPRGRQDARSEAAFHRRMGRESRVIKYIRSE